MSSSLLYELKLDAAEAFAQARARYEKLLRLSNEDTALARLSAMFQAGAIAEEATDVQAYAPVAPKLWIGFDSRKTEFCRIQHDASSVLQNTGHRDIVVTKSPLSEQSWFTIETSVPWEEVRANSRLSMTIFGSLSETGRVRPQVYYTDMDGGRHPLFTKWPSQEVSATFGLARFDLDYALPNETIIDFGKEPVLSIDFGAATSEVRLSDWVVRFE